MNRYMPVFNLELIRDQLEQLKAEEETAADMAPFTRELPTNTWLPMVPAYSEGYYNMLRNDSEATLTVFWMNQNGDVLLNFGKTENDPQLEPYRNATRLERELPNAWSFTLDPESGQWLLQSYTYMTG